MVLKTISIWGRNLDAWNHERSWKVISASQCTSACTMARDCGRDTLVALTGPYARWMTSECCQTVRWRLTRMKYCRCHCFNDWNQLVSTAVLFHNADKCWCCCLITTLTTAQLCWWCCNDALIDSCVFWAHRDSGCACTIHAEHMCIISLVGWSLIIYMHRDGCHTRQACKCFQWQYMP